MEYTKQIDLLGLEMIRFNQGDAKRVQHLLKVHRLAQMIGRMENLDAHTQFLTECAALVHDIGIRPAEEKYGACNGKLQEQEGPAYARAMLERQGLSPTDIDRVCYLVGHHHTYTQIDGMDYQILVEADFLVNFYEDGIPPASVRKAFAQIFRTTSGKMLCQTIYGIREDQNAGNPEGKAE